MGRQREVEGIVARGLGKRFQLELQPARIVGAHVHRQGLGERADPARLLGAVDPHFESVRAPRARAVAFHVPDKHRESAVRVLDHVGPGRIAAGKVGPPRPRQAGQDGCGDRLDLDAAIAVVLAEILWRGLLLGGLAHRKDRTEHAVRAVGGKSFEARFPGLEVQVLEFSVGIVLGYVDRLGDARIHERRDRGDHFFMCGSRKLQRGDEPGRQIVHVAARGAIAAPRMVLDRKLLERPVGHALFARVGPREGRLDAVGSVVGEGQADRACRRDREQVRIADPVAADQRFDVVRQARGKAAARKVEVGVEQGKRTALAGQLDGGAIGVVTHGFGNLRRHRARLSPVIAQSQHDQRIAQAGETQSHAPLGHRFLVLLLQGPGGDFEDVVEHAH